ncbi:hypothetical protein EJ02DRAFT_422876 [Clathrospora elynae]|uniref:Uncharacterized protein n=1 Tax=Clathrospora elynae TaxID=706981 RepID=A0A6A5SX46_9PLEO|nr:hypothetical protein EJ02DRAFT_422876 [Clathrospora elynae]
MTFPALLAPKYAALITVVSPHYLSFEYTALACFITLWSLVRIPMSDTTPTAHASTPQRLILSKGKGNAGKARCRNKLRITGWRLTGSSVLRITLAPNKALQLFK